MKVIREVSHNTNLESEILDTKYFMDKVLLELGEKSSDFPFSCLPRD